MAALTYHSYSASIFFFPPQPVHVKTYRSHFPPNFRLFSTFFKQEIRTRIVSSNKLIISQIKNAVFPPPWSIHWIFFFIRLTSEKWKGEACKWGYFPLLSIKTTKNDISPFSVLKPLKTCRNLLPFLSSLLSSLSSTWM